MLEAHGIAHAFGTCVVLDDVALHAAGHEVVGLIGPNGSGKTTLLRTLYRSLEPQHGTVALEGTEISGVPQRRLATRLAVVVQEGTSEMPLTVADTVLLGRTPHLGTFQRTSARDTAIAADALARVGAGHLAGRDFGVLSGGEKQRVLIARAITQQADYLLMDEPTNHLDIHFQHEVLGLVRRLDVTTVLVLHDLNLAARYCDRVVLLDEGRVYAQGSPDEVLRPAVLEPVYRIGIQRVVADDGTPQLLFSQPDQSGQPVQSVQSVQSGTSRRERHDAA